MSSVRVTAVLVAASLVVATPATAWTWPAGGDVFRAFRFGSDPYASGQHRGVDVAAELGARVVAPDAGEVTFAGAVPGNGLVVTIRTADGYAVTLAQLGALLVERGRVVAEGDTVGSVGTSAEADAPAPHVHLGVRVASEEEGYLDPIGLLPPRPPVQAPAPLPPPPPEPVPPPVPPAPPPTAMEAPAPAELAPPLPSVVSVARMQPTTQVPPAAPSRRRELPPPPPPPRAALPGGMGSRRVAASTPRTAGTGHRAHIRSHRTMHRRPAPARLTPARTTSEQPSAQPPVPTPGLTPVVRPTPKASPLRRRVERGPRRVPAAHLTRDRGLPRLGVAALAVLLGASALLLVRARRGRVGPAGAPIMDAHVRVPPEDPRRGCVAVRERPAPHRPRGGLRRPVGRLRPLPPPPGRRRADGERHRRARHADHGRGRRGGGVAA